MSEQLHFLELFAVPFAMYNLGEKSRPMNKEILNIIFNEIGNSSNQIRTGVGVWQSHADLEVRVEGIFKQLEQYFFELATPYLNKAGYTGDPSNYLECGEFWINYNQNPSAFHMPHMHGNGKTVFSGVYYPSSGIQDGTHK